LKPFIEIWVLPKGFKFVFGIDPVRDRGTKILVAVLTGIRP
jgi:hypothetical protein